MNLLTEIFSAVVAQSWRIGCLILALGVLRLMLRGQIPQQILFFSWIIVAVSLVVPLSLPVRWSPFRFVRAARLELAASLPKAKAVALPPAPAAFDETSAQSGSAGLPLAAPVNHSAAAWTPLMILAMVWAAGVGGLLGLHVLAGARFSRRLRRLPDAANPRISAAIAECADLLKIKRAILVKVTDVAGGPAIGGFWRPVVFVPACMGEDLGADELRLVLLHELGHWRRRDVPASLLLHAALILHWFNPMVWLAAWLARVDCELACDEFVMRRVSSAGAGDYGLTLLKVLDMVRGQRQTSAMLGILENKKLLQRRIHMIAHYQTWSGRRALAGCAFLALVAFVAGTRESQAHEVEAKPVLNLNTAAVARIRPPEISAAVAEKEPADETVVTTMAGSSPALPEAMADLMPVYPTQDRVTAAVPTPREVPAGSSVTRKGLEPDSGVVVAAADIAPESAIPMAAVNPASLDSPVETTGENRIESAQLDQQPVPISQSKPAYPLDMLQRGIAGEVQVDFVVDEGGAVSGVHAVNSTLRDVQGEVSDAKLARELEAAAVKGLSKWKFSPGIKNGEAVSTHVSLNLRFFPDGFDRVFHLKEVDHPPQKWLSPAPEYPPDVYAAGGSVVVDFIVSAAGDVTDAQVVVASNPAIAASTVAAISRWKYSPALKDGRKVAVHMRVAIPNIHVFSSPIPPDHHPDQPPMFDQ